MAEFSERALVVARRNGDPQTVDANGTQIELVKGAAVGDGRQRCRHRYDTGQS